MLHCTALSSELHPTGRLTPTICKNSPLDQNYKLFLHRVSWLKWLLQPKNYLVCPAAAWLPSDDVTNRSTRQGTAEVYGCRCRLKWDGVGSSFWQVLSLLPTHLPCKEKPSGVPNNPTSNPGVYLVCRLLRQWMYLRLEEHFRVQVAWEHSA